MGSGEHCFVLTSPSYSRFFPKIIFTFNSIVTKMKLPLIMFPALLSGVVAECQDDEECVLASDCIQLIPGPLDETAGRKRYGSSSFYGFDEQICENGGVTREKKVCCRNVLEK